MRYLIVLCLFLFGCGNPDLRESYLDEWSNNPNSGGIMYIGDSITAYYPDDLLIHGGYNRGIPGETTYKLLERWWLVEYENPEVIILMTGVNNMPGTQEQVDIVLTDVEQMLQRSSMASVYLLSILPATTVPIENIINTNEKLKYLCLAYDNVEFIDMYDLFYNDSTHQVVNTIDGVHPNRYGYELMLQKLTELPILQK